MFGVAGRRIRPEEVIARPTIGSRWAGMVSRRPVIVLVSSVVTLGVIALPALDLRLALPDDGMASPDSTQRKAYDLLNAGFGFGFNALLTVVVAMPASSSAQSAAESVSQQLSQLPDVTAVLPARFNPAADAAVITVIPAAGPTATSTTDLVDGIRELRATFVADTGAAISVTGLTATNIDTSDTLASALIPYLALVVGLALVLLLLVFRSVLIPIKANLGFLLTMAATFGAVVAVFQWGWLGGLFGVDQTGPVVSVMPIFLIGIMFGLAMDYQVFLVTRMREEYIHGATPKRAVTTGFTHSARVVTAAAIIMIAVFTGFILSSESLIKMMGFALERVCQS
jgi:RND superfamily putative drug exporter